MDRRPSVVYNDLYRIVIHVYGSVINDGYLYGIYIWYLYGICICMVLMICMGLRWSEYLCQCAFAKLVCRLNFYWQAVCNIVRQALQHKHTV